MNKITAKKVTEAQFSSYQQLFQSEIAKAQTEIEKLCSELDCGVLINNAGVSYDHMDFYHDLSSEKLDCLVDVNCSALMMITQAFMKRRVEEKKGENWTFYGKLKINIHSKLVIGQYFRGPFLGENYLIISRSENQDSGKSGHFSV